MRERGVQGATDGILETQDTDCFRCGVAGFRGRGCGDSAEEKLGSGQGTGRAITRAKADVVSILLSEINQGAKSPSDVTEQVPQDAIVRAAWQRQAERRRHAQRKTRPLRRNELKLDVGV